MKKKSEVDVVTDGSPVEQLTESAALALVEEVKADIKALWLKFLLMYEGGAHLALGYTRWGDFYAAEFGGPRDETGGHGYRLLRSARVVERLPIDNRPTRESVERKLVPLLPYPESMRGAAAEAFALHGDPTADQMKEVAARWLEPHKAVASANRLRRKDENLSRLADAGSSDAKQVLRMADRAVLTDLVEYRKNDTGRAGVDILNGEVIPAVRAGIAEAQARLDALRKVETEALALRHDIDGPIAFDTRIRLNTKFPRSSRPITAGREKRRRPSSGPTPSGSASTTRRPPVSARTSRTTPPTTTVAPTALRSTRTSASSARRLSAGPRPTTMSPVRPTSSSSTSRLGTR